LDVRLSIKTKQGSTEQEDRHVTPVTFKLDIAAVADAPEIKAPNGSEIETSQLISKEGKEGESIDLSNILKATTSGGDTVGTFLVYLKRPDDGSLTDYLVNRGLIEIDDGKVIPRLRLEDSGGNRIGQFMADTGANGGKGEFAFAVKASQTAEASFSPKIVFPNFFSTTEGGSVLLEIGAVSFGGRGTQAEVAKADRPTIEISIAAKADGVVFNIPNNMVARGTEELPMAMDIRGHLRDKNETISEVKLTLVGGTSGGMVVSKGRLEELAFGGKLLINLNDYTSQVDGVTTVNKAGIEALKSDSAYNNAFRADGSPKTSWRDLTEQDIKALKALDGDSELQNLATQSGDDYTLSSAVFSGNDALVKPDLAGRFNLSELLFIPPEDLAGSMDATLSIKTQQGSVVQTGDDKAHFTIEISAVADAPTLKDANGENLNVSQPIKISGNEDVTTIIKEPKLNGDGSPVYEVNENGDNVLDTSGEPVPVLVDKSVPGINLSNKFSASATGGDKVGAFLVYLTHSGNGTLKDYLVGRKLIEIDGDKVMTEMQLVDLAGNRIGEFMADINPSDPALDKFMFAVQTAKRPNEDFSAKIVFPNNFSTGDDPVL